MYNNKQKHLVVWGCFSIDNTGDSHFVPVIVKYIRSKYPLLRVTILCINELSCRRFSEMFKEDDLLSFLPSQKLKTHFSLIGRTDFMTLGPGGLFAMAKIRDLIRKYILRLSYKITGTKLVIISLGVSSPIFQSRMKLFWLNRIVKIHSYICFRHDIPELMDKYRANPNVRFGTDLLNAEGALPNVPYDTKQRVVMVSLANEIFRKSPDSVIDDFVDKMATILIVIAKKGYGVKLCAFDKSDSPLIAKVAKAASHENITALPFEYDHSVVAKWFADAELSICARFHAIVFSLNYRTPCIALSYDNKCEITMEQFGLSEYNTRFDTAEDTHFTEAYELEPERIIRLFERLESKKESAIEIINKNIPILRKKAALNYQVLDDGYLEVIEKRSVRCDMKNFVERLNVKRRIYRLKSKMAFYIRCCRQNYRIPPPPPQEVKLPTCPAQYLGMREEFMFIRQQQTECKILCLMFRREI
jgi:polysaccharide pyruvyl transferase WcaK-like protein